MASWSGQLFYGVVFRADASVFDGDGDLAAALARARGHHYPWGDDGDLPTREEVKEWRAICTQVRNDVGDLELDHAGDLLGGYGCPYVAASQIESYGGDIKPVTRLEVDPAWDVQLGELVKELGLTMDDVQGPGWFLSSTLD